MFCFELNVYQFFIILFLAMHVQIHYANYTAEHYELVQLLNFLAQIKD